MTGRGHQRFGIYGALFFFPIAMDFGLNAAFISLGIMLGAKAPDYLEIRTKNGTMIKHRTITHYLPLWISLLLCTAGSLSIGPLDFLTSKTNAEPWVWELLLGYSIGGLIHLLLDIPNPMGIPVFTINKRISLNLWRSGEAEWLLDTIAIAGLLFYLGPILLDYFK